MSGDLEAFLRQAAERRKQRQDAKKGQAPAISTTPPLPTRPNQSGSNPTSTSVRPSNRQPPSAQILDPIIIESDLVEDLANKHLPKQTWRSNVPAESHLAQKVSQADEKVESHVKAVFEHRIGSLSKVNVPSTLSRIEQDNTSSSDDSHVQMFAGSNAGANLLAMLRDPKTLKTAFIASEIFNRKF